MDCNKAQMEEPTTIAEEGAMVGLSKLLFPDGRGEVKASMHRGHTLIWSEELIGGLSEASASRVASFAFTASKLLAQHDGNV